MYKKVNNSYSIFSQYLSLHKSRKNKYKKCNKFKIKITQIVSS